MHHARGASKAANNAQALKFVQHPSLVLLLFLAVSSLVGLDVRSVIRPILTLAQNAIQDSSLPLESAKIVAHYAMCVIQPQSVLDALQMLF